MVSIDTDISFSQESKPKARLIDEYEQRYSWEYEQGFFDNAFGEYKNEPNSKILVIIYGKPTHVFWKTRTIKYYLKYERGCGNECVKVIGGGNESPAILQTWLIPQGAEEPAPKSLVSYSEMKSVPYKVGSDIYGADFRDGWVYETFAEELETNPNAKGHLIFYKDKYIDGSRYLSEVKTKLIKEYKISSSRVRIINNKDDESVGRIEFWIVPKGSSFRLPKREKNKKKK